MTQEVSEVCCSTFSAPPGKHISFTQLAEWLKECKNKGQVIDAYAVYASSHGANSCLDPETREKINKMRNDR